MSMTTFLPHGRNPRVVGSDDVVQSAADGNQQVAVLHREIARAQCNDTGSAGTKRMVGGNQIEGVPSSRNRHLEPFGGGEQGVCSASQADAVAGQNQRTFGMGEQRQHVSGCDRQIAACRGAGRRESGQFFRGYRGCLDIEWYVQPDRTLASLEHFMERTLQVIADLFRIVEGDCILGDRLHHGHDVHFLNTSLAQGATRQQVWALDLAGDDQYRHGFDPGAGNRGDDISGTGTRGHHADPKTFPHPAPGLGSNPAGLLVVTGHGHQAGFAGQGVIEMHGSPAW